MRKTLLAIAAAVILATGGANAQSNACRQSAFLFAKLAIASINCNFPASKSLAVFLDTATHFCGKGPPSAWPGSQAGALTFFDEVKKQGKAAVCARIGGEMIGLENSKNPGQPPYRPILGVRGNDYCMGTLKFADGLALFNDGLEHDQPCNIISGLDEAKVRKACSVGSKCIVFGQVNLSCKSTIEGCPEITHVTLAQTIK